SIWCNPGVIRNRRSNAAIAYQQRRYACIESRLSWFTHENISRDGPRKRRCWKLIVAVIASRRLSLTRSRPPRAGAERRLCLRHLDQNARRPGRYDLQTDEYEAGPACRAQK